MNPSSNNDFQQGKQEKRIRLLKILFPVIIFIYSFRLFSIQILSGDQYRSHAQNISSRTEILPPQRGEIYDRSYTTPLALNTNSFAVSIVPADVPKNILTDVINETARILKIPASEIEARIPVQNYYMYQPIEISTNVPYSVIAALAEHKEKLPGVLWNSKPVRNYVDLKSLSHVIGYVDNITRDELIQLYNQGYNQGDVIGKTGIERQYDELLRGKAGNETRTVNVRGYRVPGLEEYVQPETGKTLVLTIDRKIQTLAEKALGERIGAVIVMRPSNGEILAMVSYPWYDPNIFTGRDRREYQKQASDPNKPFINRAIQSSYPPASAFKVVMSTGILSENVFPADKIIDCSGEIDYGNRIWRCHIKKPGHGRLNLHAAMAQSCDIFYWQVGREALGVERIITYAREFGFGEASGIDLPDEIAGFVPTPQWKIRRFHERWLGGDTMNMAIGQGYTLVTPIQMANMVCMTINNGKIYKPHILKEVRNPLTGIVERDIKPELIHESNIDKRVFETVRRDMRGVISEGTAQYPFNRNIVQIAGKTGTAEIGLQDRWHSWFAAFAPYDSTDPEEQIVVSVIVEAVNDWEWWAPYASAIIFQGIFAEQTFEEAVRSLGFNYIIPIEGYRE